MPGVRRTQVSAISRCAVVGHPVAHSLSPALHRAGYSAIGLDWSYDAVDVAPGELPAFVAQLDASWRGLSVTMPHKLDAAKLGEPDELVRLLGVANTIVLGDKPAVFNTDVSGFVWALRSRGISQVSSALILGAGATAESILAGLASIGLTEVAFALRNPAKAARIETLAARLGVASTSYPLEGPLPTTELTASTIPTDAVPEGAAGLAGTAFDAIYHPWPTRFATQAQGAGATVISGLDLLVGQAVDQFKLLTGHSVSHEVFEEAGLAELARRQRDMEG